MVIKSKMLKLSSLCIIGTITVVVNQMDITKAYNEKKYGVDSAEVEKEAVEDPVSFVDVNQLKFDSETGEFIIPETTEDPDATPEPTPEPEVDEKAVEGIDYRDYIDLSRYTNLAIANVNQYLNVRKTPTTESTSNIIAKMPPHSGCEVLETTTNEAGETWCKVKSGEVTGYVNSDYLIQGQEALDAVPKYGRLVINVDCDVLKVRGEPSLDADVLYMINKGEQLDVISVEEEWVKVGVDFGESEEAYVSREYIEFSFELYFAIEVDELLVGYSAERTGIVATAKKYLGAPYVYGGTSLTKGIDCSAFVQKMYSFYGYKLQRDSRSQAKSDGVAISASELKPGDLVFYSNGSGVVKHVAMYIGNNKIIHASNKRDGVKISNMYYSTPCKYKKIFND